MATKSISAQALGADHGSRKPDAARISDVGLLLDAEARELMRHRSAGGSDDYIKRRAQVVDKLYGAGARDTIRELMKTIKEDDATSRED